MNRSAGCAVKKEDIISHPFSEEERQRFHNLLLLASESPFEGERVNALDAATRMATRHGMSLQEAARHDPTPDPPRQTEPRTSRSTAEWRTERDMAASVRMSEQFLRMDKERRQQAMEEARKRGLDAEERRAAQRQTIYRSTNSQSKRNPESHARVLLRETSLPLREVADLSGLDFYQVVGMKLKMRVPA